MFSNGTLFRSPIQLSYYFDFLEEGLGINLEAEVEENRYGYKKNIWYNAYALAGVDESKLQFQNPVWHNSVLFYSYTNYYFVNII